MKRIFIFLVAVVFLLNLAGCQQKEATPVTPPASSVPTPESPPDTPESPPDTPNPPEKEETESVPDDPEDPPSDPGTPLLWRANCNEYMSLWNYPGGTTITGIPRGAQMELVSWIGRYALVRYEGLEGYVMSSYIEPDTDSYLQERLNTVAVTNVYSYEQMLSDLDALKSKYPDAVTLDSIGTSELGRDIPVMRIGDPDAEHQVLIQGAIHGREHMTAWFLMAMADYWLSHDTQANSNICYHIIPMSNPDGVIISQTQTLTEQQYQIYLSDIQNGHTAQYQSIYTSVWKANGKGVDINRNFPSGWDDVDHRDGPSSELYQGSAPFSSAEAAALRDYTLSYAFDVTVSYHASGSLIYYEYGSKEPVNSQSESLAQAVFDISGYEPTGSTGIDGAGYKDWAMEELEIPSITVEIGCGDSPLAERELYSIFARNYQLLPAIYRWLQAQ